MQLSATSWAPFRPPRSILAPARPDPVHLRNVDLLGPAPPYSPCDHWVRTGPDRRASGATDMTVLDEPGALTTSQAAADGGEAKAEELAVRRVVVDEGAAAGSSGPSGGGASEERDSPLGYDVGIFSAFMLNTSQMIGGGVFTTPGYILNSLGSPGLSLVLWALGALFAFAGLTVSLELAAWFPKRSGAEVTWFFLLSITFCITTVLLSYTSTNALVFAQYYLAATNQEPSDLNLRVVAVVVVTFGSLVCFLSTRWSLRIINVITVTKLVILTFIVITGFVVLSGGTKLQDPTANFRHVFDNSTNNGNDIARSFVKILCAFHGWSNAQSCIAEMRQPVRTAKLAGFWALASVSTLYILANVAFFAAVSHEEIREAGTLLAKIFFRQVFGDGASARSLPALITISALGQIIGDIHAQVRLLREIGRQGAAPFGPFLTSTWPLGTPGGPSLVKWVVTVLLLVCVPVEDTFNFLIDLASYPTLIFTVLSAAAVYVLRARYRDAGEDRAPEFEAWHLAIWFSVVASACALVLPWVPPVGQVKDGDLDTFYAMYCVAGIALLLLCGLYYWLWMHVIPRLRGCQFKEEVKTLSNGEVLTVLVKVWKPTE